jgi:choline dehydrogenase-like flavoprotein
MSPNGQYDVIIIGNGAGGGTLARALAPTAKRILILVRAAGPPWRLELDYLFETLRWPAKPAPHAVAALVGVKRAAGCSARLPGRLRRSRSWAEPRLVTRPKSDGTGLLLAANQDD